MILLWTIRRCGGIWRSYSHQPRVLWGVQCAQKRMNFETAWLSGDDKEKKSDQIAIAEFFSFSLVFMRINFGLRFWHRLAWLLPPSLLAFFRFVYIGFGSRFFFSPAHSRVRQTRRQTMKAYDYHFGACTVDKRRQRKKYASTHTLDVAGGVSE